MSRLALVVAACLLAAAWPAAASIPFESLSPPCVAAQEGDWLTGTSRQEAKTIWRVAWTAPPSMPVLALEPVAFASVQAEPQRRRPVAIEYSHGYEVRRTIHKWASIVTLPLFVAEFAVGQSLYNDTTHSGSKRGAHVALAGGIAGLFAVNTVTGAWNLWEGRRDTNGRTRRLVHGILMLAADAGFVATGATAPGDGEHHGAFRPIDTNARSRHRAIALTSMGTALGSYLMMLLWRD